MLKIKKIIMESLYDDTENGIIEFTYGQMPFEKAQEAFSKLQKSLENIGVNNSVNYGHMGKIAIITTKDKAQKARELAEVEGFQHVNEIFDTAPKEEVDDVPIGDSKNARVGSGFNRRWGF